MIFKGNFLNSLNIMKSLDCLKLRDDINSFLLYNKTHFRGCFFNYNIILYIDLIFSILFFLL